MEKINEFFEYGINGECLHFHLPGDFHDMFQNLGKVKASSIIVKNLIDAANKINNQIATPLNVEYNTKNKNITYPTKTNNNL